MYVYIMCMILHFVLFFESVSVVVCPGMGIKHMCHLICYYSFKYFISVSVFALHMSVPHM